VEQEVLESNIQEEISKKVNLPNELFPDGVNVSFVHCSKPGSINVNTYERGVGFTNACGTAMSASSLVSILQNYNEFNSKINVYNNGGMVQCVVRNNDNQYSIDLIGNATYLYKCKIHWDKIGNHFTILDKSILSEEEDYKKFQKNKALKKYT
jgi:diaminopimelate epimerase